MTGYESKRAAAQDKLAQPAQEPVFVTYKEVADTMNMLWRGKPKQVAIAIEMENMRLYTTPPQRPWVGLTDEEVCEICDSYYNRDSELAQMVEAKLKEKNT